MKNQSKIRYRTCQLSLYPITLRAPHVRLRGDVINRTHSPSNGIEIKGIMFPSLNAPLTFRVLVKTSTGSVCLPVDEERTAGSVQACVRALRHRVLRTQVCISTYVCSDLFSNFRATVWHTLRGLFSSASTPMFASKYLFESSWRDLQDSHTFAPLRYQNFSQKSSTFFREWINEFPIFSFFVWILDNLLKK